MKSKYKFLLGVFFIIVTIWYGYSMYTRTTDGRNNEYLALGEFYSKKCDLYNSDDLVYKDKFSSSTLLQCDNGLYFVNSTTYKNSINYYHQYVRDNK